MNLTIHNSLNRIILCILIVLSLLISSGSVLQGEDTKDINSRIEDLKKEYDESKKELEESKRRLKIKERERQDVLKKLKNSDRDIAKLNRTLITIKSKERHLNEEITASQKRLIKTEQNLKAHSGEYAQSLRSMYKRQRISALELFFSSVPVSSMLRGFKMYRVIAKEDVKMLERIREQKQIIATSMRKVTNARNAQRNLGVRKKREQVSLERTRNEKKIILDEIKHDEELEKKLIIQNQKVMEKSHAEIEKLQRQISRAVNKRDFLKDISDDIKNYNFAGRKGKLPWPVSGEIVSTFGVITDPKTKTKTRNRGIEIETNHGEPVYAVGSGIVMVTQSIRGYGNFIMIYHPPDYVTIYAHLSNILVNMDAEVREGETIGLTGSTGMIDDSRSRLLLEILKGKNPENPLRWLKPDRQRTRS